jgi:DnaK suppressor protein
MPTKVNGLTKKQTEELHKVLLTRKAELIASIDESSSSTMKVAPDQVIEDMDSATNSADQAVRLRVMDKESKLLKEIERALAKFENDEYGLCEGSEEPIGYKRLKVVPWTRYSIAYKEQREREQQQLSGRLAGR